jgi:manganese transport protein
VNKALELTLGIMAALGGFVDIGELVFTTQAGSRFGYSLLWAVLLGTIGIIIYCEMCGRIAVVADEPVFNLIKDYLPKRLAFITLVGSSGVNLITCAAEIGGIAILLRLLTGLGYFWMVPLGVVALAVLVWVLPFKWIERTFGFAGLLMCVYFVVAVALHPDWGRVSHGFIPVVPSGGWKVTSLYAYFIVGILSSVMMPYEVYFYSSGGIEEDWDVSDLPVNFAITNIGFVLGSGLAMALMVIGAAFFMPAGISPERLATTALSASSTFGRTGLLLGLFGMMFTIAGSAVETCLSGAYNICQYFDIKWGRKFKESETPVFTQIWMVIFVLAMILVLTGIDPVQLVEYSVIFAVVVLPFTYYPVLRAGGDRKLMGRHTNPKVVQWLGWLFLALITVAALAAVPLMVVTHMGQG